MPGVDAGTGTGTLADSEVGRKRLLPVVQGDSWGLARYVTD